MFNLKDKKKETEYVELPEKFVIEHETEKAYLIKDAVTLNVNWFSKSQVRVEGDKITMSEWLYKKDELFNNTGAGEGEEE